MRIIGIGEENPKWQKDFIELQTSSDGLWCTGRNGVRRILSPLDRKVEFVAFDDKTLACVRSAMGYPAIYELRDAHIEAPVEAVLMDLDGTSVRSEGFWMWIIERTTARLLGDEGFELAPEDEPHVSGHSVSEHLQYCIKKYCPGKTVEEARRYYFEIVHREMKEILAGRGRVDAFKPSPGLKEFLLELKARGVKIALVTSGLYEKAWPEIVAAFRQMNLGDPLEFYDAIVTAGFAIRKGTAGTLGELEPKPHPWLYAEAARVGLGIDPSKRHKVAGLEDSGAGVVSIRLAGFAAIGMGGGNIEKSGVGPLLAAYCQSLPEALPILFGRG